MLNHKICLVLGDWSHDGHGLTSRYHIVCSLSKKELEKAYKKGCKKVGKDFSMEEKVARDYEDPTIDHNILAKIRELGYKEELECEYEDLEEGQDDEGTNEPLNDENEGITISENDFVYMWMFLASLGIKETLEWEIIADGDEIHLGGYGLFYS